MRRVSEEEHRRRLELYKRGYSDAKIAEILNLNQSTITRWRKANKLPPNHRRNGLDEETLQKFLKLYKQNLTDEEIAEIMGRRPCTIKLWRARYKLPKIKICPICGSRFKVEYRYKGGKRRYCDRCARIVYNLHTEIYFLMKSIRRDYAEIAKINPKKAQLLAYQMAEEEGANFMRFVLDGIYEKVTENLQKQKIK